MNTSFVFAFGLAQTFPAYAAQITGEVKAANEPIISRLLGYTKTRIVAASSALRNKKEDLALYLEVKNSLPLKPPTAQRFIRIHGLSFSPSVMACVFEEIIVFKNDDRKPVTLVVNDKPVSTIEPREELNYKCEEKGLARLRLKELKQARGTVFIGTTGVAARPDALGKFTMFAPEGTYELKVINANGVIHTSPVEIGVEDLDLGLLGAEQTVDEVPSEANTEEAAATEEVPPGPQVVIPPPAPPVPPPVPANAIRPPPPKPVIPAVAPIPTPAPKPAAAVKFPAPIPKAPAAKPAPKPAPAPAAVAAPPPPPPKKKAAPAAAPAPAAKPKPKPKPKPAPEPEEEEDSLDEFFEMEE